MLQMNSDNACNSWWMEEWKSIYVSNTHVSGPYIYLDHHVVKKPHYSSEKLNSKDLYLILISKKSNTPSFQEHFTTAFQENDLTLLSGRSLGSVKTWDRGHFWLWIISLDTDMLETGNLIQWWWTMGAFEKLSLYFFMKTKCLALWHTKCVKIFFSILASHFELRGHQSKCCRL